MLALLALAAMALSACTPTPEPIPQPTAAFASEQEAFAAAEEVYRAYNDAVNSRIAGAEGPNPQDFLTAVALESDIDTANLFLEKDIHLEGEGLVASFRGESAALESVPQSVTATTCLDATATRVVSGTGEDVTPTSRPDVSALEVTFVVIGDQVRISDSVLAEDQSC